MNMSASRKRVRPSDVLKALESGEFDNIYVPELDDSCSEGEEPITSDVVINGDTKLDICDVVCHGSDRVDACFKDSFLLDDVELNNEADNDSDIENVAATPALETDTDTGKNPDSTAGSSKNPNSSAKKPSENRRPFAVVNSSKGTRRNDALEWKSSFQDIQPFHMDDVPGASRVVYRCQTPLDFFKLFFTTVVWTLLVSQTNLYYRQSVSVKPSVMEWVDVTVEEMMAFVGLVIAMGVVRLPEIDDYWATDPMLQHPWFASIMSRTRFKQIVRYLHCADNISSVSTDKLRKLRSVVDMLNVSFRQMYTPSQCLSIDESMVGTKCRISFLQYMPKKPKKFGIKLWALCESLTGYCLQFQVYTGKVESAVEHGLAYRVVFDLMKHYLDKGYHLYMDNFYTSYELFTDLLRHKTGACGTVRSNRLGFPKQLQGKIKMQRGEAKFLQ